MTDVREECPVRRKLLNVLQCFRDSRVRRMRLVPKSIQKEHVEAAKFLKWIRLESRYGRSDRPTTRIDSRKRTNARG